MTKAEREEMAKAIKSALADALERVMQHNGTNWEVKAESVREVIKELRHGD